RVSLAQEEELVSAVTQVYSSPWGKQCHRRANCRGAIDRSGGVRPKLLQHRQPPGRRAHRFPCRTGNWLCAVLPARWFYTAAIGNVVERRRTFKCQANERRIGVPASTFA